MGLERSPTHFTFGSLGLLSRITLAPLALLLAVGAPALAQNAPRPAATAELSAGYAGFADDGTIGHGLVGGAMRVYVTQRLAVGPEVVYMVGPGNDRDIFATGNLTFDLRSRSGSRPPRLVPYLLAGGGWFQHRDRFAGQTFRSNEGTFTAGGGVRGWLSDATYVGAEYRVGWELHYRLTGHVGFAIGR
jgi:hypothetical protein